MLTNPCKSGGKNCNQLIGQQNPHSSCIFFMIFHNCRATVYSKALRKCCNSVKRSQVAVRDKAFVNGKTCVNVVLPCEAALYFCQ